MPTIQNHEDRIQETPDRRRTKLSHDRRGPLLESRQQAPRDSSDSEVDDVMAVYEKRERHRRPSPKRLQERQPVKHHTSSLQSCPPQKCMCVRRQQVVLSSLPVLPKRYPMHSPLGSVLAQYKEAEMHWAKEKAALRREASQQRQRAHKLDLENRKLMASNKHKAMDIASLKSALSSRDTQLQTVQEKLNRYECALTQTQEAQEQQTADVIFERDELRRLLTATMRRLEGVDHFIHDTLSNSTELEKRLEEMQQQRIDALQVASKSHALKSELDKAKKKLKVQQKVLTKVADIQLKKNKKQKAAIQDILNFAADRLEGKDVDEASNKSADDGLPNIEDILGPRE